MNSRLPLIIALGGLMLINTSRAEENKHPNAILFVADDLGYGETGIQGNTEIPTHSCSLPSPKSTSPYSATDYKAATPSTVVVRTTPIGRIVMLTQAGKRITFIVKLPA